MKSFLHGSSKKMKTARINFPWQTFCKRIIMADLWLLSYTINSNSLGTTDQKHSCRQRDVFRKKSYRFNWDRGEATLHRVECFENIAFNFPSSPLRVWIECNSSKWRQEKCWRCWWVEEQTEKKTWLRTWSWPRTFASIYVGWFINWKETTFSRATLGSGVATNQMIMNTLTWFRSVHVMD